VGRPPETGLARRVTRSTSLLRYHKRKVIVNPGKLRFYTIGLLIQIGHIARCIGFLILDSLAPRGGGYRYIDQTGPPWTTMTRAGWT